MDPSKYIAVGTIVSAVIAAIILCINNWLQGRRVREKWFIAVCAYLTFCCINQPVRTG